MGWPHWCISGGRQSHLPPNHDGWVSQVRKPSLDVVKDPFEWSVVLGKEPLAEARGPDSFIEMNETRDVPPKQSISRRRPADTVSPVPRCYWCGEQPRFDSHRCLLILVEDPDSRRICSLQQARRRHHPLRRRPRYHPKPSARLHFTNRSTAPPRRLQPLRPLSAFVPAVFRLRPTCTGQLQWMRRVSVESRDEQVLANPAKCLKSGQHHFS